MNIKKFIKHIVVNSLLVFISILFFVIFAELAIRTYHFFNPLIIELDHPLGWQVNPGVKFKQKATDASGKFYTINYAVDDKGFREWGETRSDNPRVFFIGDSFTHAIEVSNDKTYYSVLNHELPIEVFAYGCVGYSTLQEYMILEKYFDKIQPDLVVLQFSANDIINNHYEMEFNCETNNNGLRRPYLKPNGDINYRLPKENAFIRNLIIQNSEFLYFIMSRLDMFFLEHDNSFEAKLKKLQHEHPVYQEAVSITDLIFSNIKDISEKTPVLTFSVDRYQPYYESFIQMAEKHQFIIDDEVNIHLNKAQEDGVNIYAKDKAHWNETGHQVCAKALIKSISEILVFD